MSGILDDRRTLDAALMAMPPETHAALRALCLSALRHLGQIDALIRGYLNTPLSPKRRVAIQALRLGVAELLVLRNPPHAVVDEFVQAVKESPDHVMAGLVNAVLKQVAAQMPDLPDCRHNLPALFERRWKASYGKSVTDTICAVAVERPPLDLHTKQSFAEGARLDEVIWRMPAGHPPVRDLTGFAEGSFFVQDIAASLPVRMLGDVQGMRVLDIGAAPGGKTMQLAQGGAHVVSLDKSESRSARIHENLSRLQLTAEVVVADAMEYSPAELFDVVVLDAPCSATGTWRRHPEVVHITTEDDIAELALMQRVLLERAWGWVKPGGRLLYCTCSLEREEGEDQRDWFLDARTDASLLCERLSLIHI